MKKTLRWSNFAAAAWKAWAVVPDFETSHFEKNVPIEETLPTGFRAPSSTRSLRDRLESFQGARVQISALGFSTTARRLPDNRR